jgi:hypothetical protein
MKAIQLVFCVSFFVWWGLPVTADDSLPKWDPHLIEGGFMFKDTAAFRRYLLSADKVAFGRLTARDDQGGKVRIEKVLRGPPVKDVSKEISFTYSGGLARSSPGDKVLVVLDHKDGRAVLHSFCGASGLFSLKGELPKLVEKLLRTKE